VHRVTLCVLGERLDAGDAKRQCALAGRWSQWTAPSPDLRHLRQAVFLGRAPGQAGFEFSLLPNIVHARPSAMLRERTSLVRFIHKVKVKVKIVRLLLSMREHKKPISLVLISLLVLLIGILDRWIGSEIEFGVIYLIPALLAAIINKRLGLVIAFASALMAFIVDLSVNGHTANLTFYLWDFLSNTVIFSLITFLLSDLLRSRQHERELARTDPLTGAMNVRAFYELEEAEIYRADRYKHPFTVAYMDIDNFKVINDTLGHSMGNRLLCNLVTSIKGRARKTDIVARLGGDEFALLLPETDQETAQIVISEIQNHLTDEIHKNNWSATFSIGVLTFTQIPPTVEKMIEAADTLMYVVKQNGKNSIKYSTYVAYR